MNIEEDTVVVSFTGPKFQIEEMLDFIFDDNPETGLGFPDFIKKMEK